MQYLKIQNAGELDIRLLSLMGGTTKSDDDYKIGQWGSGLKYAISWLLRNNIGLKVFIGEQEVSLSTVDENVRGTDFRIITINGEKTSLTTQMGGEDWLPWMIIREIYCNALDEGASGYEITSEIVGNSGHTSFYIQMTPEISRVVDKWGDYFIHDETPIFENENFAIYYSNCKGIRLYKQGVLIKADKEVPNALFRYDIKDAKLNELREFNGSVGWKVLDALSSSNETVVRYFYENVSENCYEGSDEIPYEYGFSIMSPDWKNALGDAKLVNAKYLDKLLENNVIQDAKDYISVPEGVYKFLNKKFEGLGALVSINSCDYFISNNKGMVNRLNQAFAVLETCEYYVNKDLEWKVGVFTSSHVQAQIDIAKKLVVVSEAMLACPLFEIISMVIEENEHYVTKFNDCSRELQTHFINKYVRELLARNKVEM